MPQHVHKHHHTIALMYQILKVVSTNAAAAFLILQANEILSFMSLASFLHLRSDHYTKQHVLSSGERTRNSTWRVNYIGPFYVAQKLAKMFTKISQK